MYDLNKIIIIGDYTPNQQEELQTIVMVTDGLRVDSLLYLDDINSLVEKGTVKDINCKYYCLDLKSHIR